MSYVNVNVNEFLLLTKIKTKKYFFWKYKKKRGEQFARLNRYSLQTGDWIFGLEFGVQG